MYELVSCMNSCAPALRDVGGPEDGEEGVPWLGLGSPRVQHLVMCGGGVDCTLLLQHSAAAAACGGNSSWSIFAKCEPTIIIIIKCRASTMCKIELESA